MTDKKLDEKVIEEAGKQIAEYIKTNCHPYITVIITAERVTVVEDVLSIPIK
ncbi:MAG: hypothetical protein KH828_07655 [Clostridiales bacterium]|nr:hypothetical protein [Clostridiales bacterium]